VIAPFGANRVPEQGVRLMKRLAAHGDVLHNDRSRVPRLSRRGAGVNVTSTMAEGRECPLCGGTMRLRRTEHAVQIPGNPRPTTRTSAEWSCPECDYFEEADDETK
jgi:hypothetical protein